MHSISIGLTIVLTSKWHCGSGEGGLISDRLIQRDSRRRPFIPGSTIRGVVREHCEKLCRVMKFGDPTDPHDPSLDLPGKFAPLSEAPSPVEAIFGNNFEEGGLFFRNAYLVEEPAAESFIQSRTAMDRFLGVVREKHLFSTEYAVPLLFQSSIAGFHQQLLMYESLPYAYWILLLGLMSVGRLGGDKSTGSGSVEISLDAIYYNGQTVSVEDILSYLDLLEIWVEEYHQLRASQS